MICENPYTKMGAQAYPCGACVPCRQKAKMVWKTRLTLESMGHPYTTFATLTYRPEERPLTSAGLPTLTPLDLRNWLKRFRKAIQPLEIRFYAAGEYSPAELPHYHIIIFGYQACYYGKSRYADGHTIDCCSQCDTIRGTWGKGIIQCEPAGPEHMGYCAGYVMKKMTSKYDIRLKGRYPEFSRQSNGGRTGKGGLGYSSVKQLARVSKQRLDTGKADDVVDVIRIKGKKAILGRYIRNKIRKELGLEEKASAAVQARIMAELLVLLEASKTDSQALTLKTQLIKKAQGAIDSIKAQYEMNNSRKRNRTL